QSTGRRGQVAARIERERSRIIRRRSSKVSRGQGHIVIPGICRRFGKRYGELMGLAQRVIYLDRRREGRSRCRPGIQIRRQRKVLRCLCRLRRSSRQGEGSKRAATADDAI